MGDHDLVIGGVRETVDAHQPRAGFHKVSLFLSLPSIICLSIETLVMPPTFPSPTRYVPRSGVDVHILRLWVILELSLAVLL